MFFGLPPGTIKSVRNVDGGGLMRAVLLLGKGVTMQVVLRKARPSAAALVSRAI